jgi:hypothetical protein
MITQRRAGTSHVKGHVQHENSIYNNWRFDDVWLDQ